jgi:hypothetical protein
MSGHASHVAGGGVVYHAAQRRLIARQEFRGCNPRAQGKRRLKPRVGHPQRLEDHLPGVLGERLPREAADDLPEQDEVDVAVGESLSGPGHRLVDER